MTLLEFRQRWTPDQLDSVGTREETDRVPKIGSRHFSGVCVSHMTNAAAVDSLVQETFCGQKTDEEPVVGVDWQMVFRAEAWSQFRPVSRDEVWMLNQSASEQGTALYPPTDLYRSDKCRWNSFVLRWLGDSLSFHGALLWHWGLNYWNSRPNCPSSQSSHTQRTRPVNLSDTLVLVWFLWFWIIDLWPHLRAEWGFSQIYNLVPDSVFCPSPNRNQLISTFTHEL